MVYWLSFISNKYFLNITKYMLKIIISILINEVMIYYIEITIWEVYLDLKICLR